jgi:choline dehydrogenase-like flavoprotein
MLRPDQRQTLALICDTFIPTLPAAEGDDAPLFALRAADLNLAALVEEALTVAATPIQQLQIQTVLDVLQNEWFNGIVHGQWATFTELDLNARTELLRGWAESPLPQARQWFQSLKRLSMFLFYAAMPQGKPHPAWAHIGYTQEPRRAPDFPRALSPLSITADTVLTCDVLVIGSGAGGGVVAAQLAEAGQDVLIVEKGVYAAEADFDGRELRSTQSYFERQGALSTADSSMTILAGSVLGGGTTINWSASLRPPADVLDEWERVYGFEGASSPEFQHSLDAVEARMHISTAECSVNPTNSILERGAQQFGYATAPIPRNVQGCTECGFCNFGCAQGAKQGTLKTYLPDAVAHGARIIVQAHAQHITHSRGQVTGALLQVTGADGRIHRVEVQAKAVVVAAGALQTPALLMRSGLTNHNIGSNLHLHPVTVTYGVFPHPVEGWCGPPMTRLVTEFANLDGRGYGVRLETAPVHPGIAGLSFPWQSGAGHKRMMQRLSHMANIIIVTRDCYGGRITLDHAGEPCIHYNLHRHDAAHLMRGTVESLRIHLAAGALEVCAPHNAQLTYRPADGNLEDYLTSVESRGLKPNAYALFSAHQMSSCRIGGDSARGAFSPDAESYEIRNLFVADGSVLPTASGVNPMLTIMGTVHYLAQRIRNRL